MCVAMSTGAMLGLGAFAAVLVAAGVGALVLRNKVRDFSREVFGTDSLAEGISRQSESLATTPKSVSSMTRLMEPQIVKDFPGFLWEEFKHKAENMLTSALVAISAEDAGRLKDASDEVREQVENRIAENYTAGIREVYENIHIHQTEIADYRKENGKCIIVIQTALEYLHYKLSGERVTAGSKERKEQAKYNLELLYIRDADLAGDANAASVTCPHCGAPIKNLGNMSCEYCGAAVEFLKMKKVWSLHRFYEVDYKHM